MTCTRRRREPEPSSVSGVGKLPSSLRAIERAILEGWEAEPGSREAYDAAQTALAVLGHLLKPSFHAAVGLSDRAAWIEACQKLASVGPFTEQMRSLVIALEELNRGVTVGELMPKKGGRRGGVRPTSDLRVMRQAVEATNELRRRSGKIAALRAELSECGTALRTVEGYASKLEGTTFRSRLGFRIYYGNVEPKDVLRDAIDQLATGETRVSGKTRGR